MRPPPHADSFSRRDTYLRDIIRHRGFAPGNFTGASGKREILKMELDPLLARMPEFKTAVGLQIASLYINDILPHAPVTHVGGPSLGGQLMTEAFNQGLIHFGHPPLRVFNLPKNSLGTVGEILEGFYKTGSRALLLDDILNRGGSAMRSLKTIRGPEIGMSVTHILALVIRSTEGVNAMKHEGVTALAPFTVAQVLPPENIQAWNAFYGTMPFGSGANF